MRAIFKYALVAVVVVLAAGFYVLSPEIGRPTYGLVLQQGEAIRRALESYRIDHQAYPANLEHLTPRYIDRIAKPKLYGRQFKLQLMSGVDWDYQAPEAGSSYSLRLTNGGRVGYDNETEQWNFAHTD